MKINRYFSAFFLALTLVTVLPTIGTYAQRTSRIYRPCPFAPSTPAKVEVSSSNRIVVRTCNVSSGEAEVEAGTVRIGDINDHNNSTKIILDDNAQTIQLNANGGTTAGTLTAGDISLSSFLTFTNPGGNAILLARTLTPAGTTGNRTINAMAGSVNFAAGTSSITVTNTNANATSLVFCSIQTNDATATACRVTDKGASTFNIRLNANATAETSVAFWVTN